MNRKNNNAHISDVGTGILSKGDSKTGEEYGYHEPDEWWALSQKQHDEITAERVTNGMCNGKGKDKTGQGKGGRVSSKGGGGRGGAGRGAGNRNVSFADKKLTSTVASFVRKTLLDPGKKEEDEKDSLEEVVCINPGGNECIK